MIVTYFLLSPAERSMYNFLTSLTSTGDGLTRYIYFNDDETYQVVKKMKLCRFNAFLVYRRKPEFETLTRWINSEELTLPLFQSIVSGPPKKDS